VEVGKLLGGADCKMLSPEEIEAGEVDEDDVTAGATDSVTEVCRAAGIDSAPQPLKTTKTQILPITWRMVNVIHEPNKRCKDTI
jgi:hypothetical protein